MVTSAARWPHREWDGFSKSTLPVPPSVHWVHSIQSSPGGHPGALLTMMPAGAAPRASAAGSDLPRPACSLVSCTYWGHSPGPGLQSLEGLMLGRGGHVALPGISSLFSVPPAYSGNESGSQGLLVCLVKFLLTGFLCKIFFNIVCMCTAHVCVCVG